MAKKKSGGGILGKLIKGVLFLVLLLLLVVGGFAAGVYFQLIDSEQTQEVNEALELYKLPVVGQFFDVPEGVEPEITTTTTVETVTNGLTGPGGNQSAKAEVKPEPKKSKEVKVSQKDIEKQMQEREAAEKKRISKLSRIYNAMKPEDAANALMNLDYDTAVLILQKMDEGVVGQVLSKMDPSTAARITQLLFEGTQRRLTLPTDYLQGAQANEEFVDEEQPESAESYPEDEEPEY